MVAKNDLTGIGTAVGGTPEQLQDQGGGGVNPFIKGDTTETFNLVDLVGGADLYGVKEDLTSADPYFSTVVSGAPAGAIAAIYNQNIGSSGDNYLNQNSLFFINLTGRCQCDKPNHSKFRRRHNYLPCWSTGRFRL